MPNPIYKSSFPDGESIDAALTVAANIDATREGTGTKFLKDDFTWEAPPGQDIAFGTAAGTACEGNDARLSDARTPTTHGDSSHAGNAKRNNPDGVAGLYSCKTILNEHRPVCTKEYHLTGKYLDGTDNPDVWFPIAGGNGSVAYATRFLTVTGATAAVAANRAVIDQVQFPIYGNFEEVTCRIGTVVAGAGGVRNLAVGFQSAFSAFQAANRCTFYFDGTNWYVGYNGGQQAVASLPLGRNLQAGDIVTVRLDREEGWSNINIVRFYVNGQKQYETASIPTVNMYAGIGVFSDATVTTAMSIAIDYFGMKYVP